MSYIKTKKKEKPRELHSNISISGCVHNNNYVAPGRSVDDLGRKLNTDCTLKLKSSFILSDHRHSELVGRQLADWLLQNLPYGLFLDLKKELNKQ